MIYFEGLKTQGKVENTEFCLDRSVVGDKLSFMIENTQLLYQTSAVKIISVWDFVEVISTPLWQRLIFLALETRKVNSQEK